MGQMAVLHFGRGILSALPPVFCKSAQLSSIDLIHPAALEVDTGDVCSLAKERRQVFYADVHCLRGDEFTVKRGERHYAIADHCNATFSADG
jgi:hypothetical protein